MVSIEQPSDARTDTRDFLGHPRGLAFLFTTEMWERFSYYGMRALLVLYMVKYLLLPGNAETVIGLATLKSALESVFGPLGTQPFSSHIYGLYTGLVYLTPFFGGLIADRLLGQHRTILIGAALALLLFVQAFVRLRRRRAEHAPWSRALLFAAGLALLVVPLVSPLDHAGDEQLLSAHMLQHVLIGDAAPALLVTAVRGPLLFFLLPPALLRPLASFRPLRAFLSALLLPLVSLGLWTVTIVVWHVPSAYDYAAAHPLVHDLEHLSFVVAGLLVWTQLVDPARHGALRRPQRIFFALAMLALAQPLVDALLFSSGAAYPRYTWQVWTKDGTRYDFSDDAWWGWKSCPGYAYMEAYKWQLTQGA
jgi:cytochrome c oxidase assembly factor CtaG